MKKTTFSLSVFFATIIMVGCNSKNGDMPVYDANVLYNTPSKDTAAMTKINDSLVIESWEQHYASQYKMNVDFSKLTIPQKPSAGVNGPYRLVVIAKGITVNAVYNSWTFPKWSYSKDLDKSVPIHARVPRQSYAIWVHDGVEPDASSLGQSTAQADPGMTIGMTLLERMILESKYFEETGKHLDVKGVTFCSGSRHSDGGVPRVYQDTDGEVGVGWYGLGGSGSRSGIRRAVTL